MRFTAYVGWSSVGATGLLVADLTNGVNDLMVLEALIIGGLFGLICAFAYSIRGNL